MDGKLMLGKNVYHTEDPYKPKNRPILAYEGFTFALSSYSKKVADYNISLKSGEDFLIDDAYTNLYDSEKALLSLSSSLYLEKVDMTLLGSPLGAFDKNIIPKYCAAIKEALSRNPKEPLHMGRRIIRSNGSYVDILHRYDATESGYKFIKTLKKNSLKKMHHIELLKTLIYDPRKNNPIE